jgi:predicted metal-dependent hydrolase
MQALSQLSYSPTRPRMLHEEGKVARTIGGGRLGRGSAGTCRPPVSRAGATLRAMASTIEWRAPFRLPGGPVELTIRRSSRARLLRLTIDPRHTAVVTVPTRAARSKAEAERVAADFVREREEWLRRHLERQARQRATVTALGPLRDGGTFPYRGEAHRLRIVAAAPHHRTAISREGGDEGDELVIRLSARERRPLEAILEGWLRERARTTILREIERHATALGVRPASVAIRDGRTRWGSCSKARRLSFSWRLVLAPPEALETVVVHELSHIRVFGHGPEFWAIVASRRPDHRIWRKWLRDHSFQLHSALDRG